MGAQPQDIDRDAFFDWISRELKPRALDLQIRARVFSKAMANVDYLPDVLDRQANQKEFALPIWEYLDIAASDERARNGRQMLRRHRDLLNRIELAFSVDPEVITAIWGLETGYGVVRGTVPTLSALATLAFRGRRARYFEDELIAALRIVQTRGCPAESLVGSWAGALGHGQFMPSAVIDFAVDFDGDGRTDLCGDDPTDALASIGHYLKKHSWKKGQPWGFEVRLPEGFDYALSGTDQTLPSRDWAEMGVTGADGGPVPDYGAGSVLLPAGAGGIALLVLRNFHVITRYNKSEAYAIGIGHLSDRILGARPFRARWPGDDPVLSQGDIGEVQYLLTRAGFDTFGIDGMRGPNTLRAVRAWQSAEGLVPDGYITAELLARLRGQESV
jgi:peptidoglycan lytic transglycosylase B